MRHFILGGKGLLGQALYKVLTGLGEECVAFGGRGTDEDASICRLPITSDDIVYFCAWDVGGGKYLYDPNTQLFQIENNTKLLMNVMPQIQQVGARAIFVSSHVASVNQGAYGVTKRLGEIWALALGFPVVRIQNIYGFVKSEKNKNHVITDFILQALDNKEIKMETTGEEVRDFLYVDDAARSLIKIGEIYEAKVHCVWSNSPIKVRYIAETIAKKTGATVSYGQFPGNNYYLPIAGTLEYLKQITPIEEGIERTIALVKENE